MSKRNRHRQKQPTIHQIEWLKHRTGYPTAEERDQIIKLRQELSMQLIGMMVMGGKPDNAQVQTLVKTYGAQEVDRANRNLGEVLNMPSFVADDANSYRDYRLRYARFGAGLKFYTAKGINDLYQTTKSSAKGLDDSDAYEEYEKVLLFGWRDWDDITPPAIPPRPEDFSAPEPTAYPAPINELLEWGEDLHRSHNFSNEADFLSWKKYIPALTRMALDPGLLNGWVTDKASWTPWHAIHALGVLKAWESAPALAKLADLENDWLSDHLPHIWVEMGYETEPSLWMILENNSATPKQRGLAAQSLSMLAEDSDGVESKVIKGFVKILGNTNVFDPSVNAYLIHFLRELNAEDKSWESIEMAFAENRVNLEIITPEDFEDEDFIDMFDDDFENDNDE